jgi:hypothetical protein
VSALNLSLGLLTGNLTLSLGDASGAREDEDEFNGEEIECAMLVLEVIETAAPGTLLDLFHPRAVSIL